MIRYLLMTVSSLALVATIAPSMLFAGGVIDLDQTKMAMLAATLVWFIATPLWMERGQATTTTINSSTNIQ